MRPPVRLLKPLEAPSFRNSKNVLYVCSNCRYDASLLPSSTQHNHQSRRYASGNTPFTEKLRRRIWGTDNPPGLEDPYGGEGVIASEWAKRKAQYMEKREIQPEEEEEEQSPAAEEKYEYEDGEDLIPEDFSPATTAHDLPRMGHLSQWSDFPPTEGDVYQPFVSCKRASDSTHFRSAAQSVAIELSLLHELKKPLSLACDVTRHDKMIWDLIRSCRINNGEIQFPNKKTKEALFFVFNQLGETPEAQTEAAAEASEQPKAEAEAVAEEELEVEEAAEPGEPQGIVDAVYSNALEAKRPPKHEGYFQFSLADPAVKFAFFKRYSQITGHHMQDICVYKAKTVGDVIEHVERVYRRPKKLAAELRTLKETSNIPNLAIYSKRYTKGRQDRENGRAKLVEAALRERGLLRSEQEDKLSKFRL